MRWPFCEIGVEAEQVEIAIIYLLIMNTIGVVIMGSDKSRARRKVWRIPEQNLFLVSVLGGSIGTWAGMYLFRHKTKHWYFVIGMPLILVLQLVFLYFLYTHRN